MLPLPLNMDLPQTPPRRSGRTRCAPRSGTSPAVARVPETPPKTRGSGRGIFVEEAMADLERRGVGSGPAVRRAAAECAWQSLPGAEKQRYALRAQLSLPKTPSSSTSNGAGASPAAAEAVALRPTRDQKRRATVAPVVSQEAQFPTRTHSYERIQDPPRAKRRARRDPNRPVMPKAYHIFRRESGLEGKVLSRRYAALTDSEREVLDAKYQAELAEFNRAMEIYDAAHGDDDQLSNLEDEGGQA